MTIKRSDHKQIIKRILLIFIAIIISSSSTFGDIALAYDSFYSNNDILFYDPNAQTPTGDNGNCIPSGSIVEKVWSYFIQKGLTEEQTAGIMGNIYQESYISPTSWETINESDKTSLENIKNGEVDSHAWGLVQWDHTRKYDSYTNSSGVLIESGIVSEILKNPTLSKYLASSYHASGAVITGSDSSGYVLTDENPLASKGIPESDLNELLTFELDYVWSEMPNEKNYSANDGINSLDKIKSTTTILEATIAFHDYFERSADTDYFIRTTRLGYSQAIYNKMHGSSFNSECPSGDRFIDTVKQYVWPTHRGWYDNTNVSAERRTGIVAITPTAGYKTAVDNALSARRYVGDLCFGGGIDCGGFVTTIVHDSGLDINYNEGKGNTITQRAWLSANWQNLGDATTIDTSILQPGDVAIEDGHTFIYIGTIEGFESKVASASQCQRAPMAGSESLTGSGYTWYRKK